MPSPEALKAAHRIAVERYGSAGGNYSADAEIIDAEIASLRSQLAAAVAERDRLREACEAMDTWAKAHVRDSNINKGTWLDKLLVQIRAALAPKEPKP